MFVLFYCSGSLYAGDAFWYWKNYIAAVSHCFLHEG